MGAVVIGGLAVADDSDAESGIIVSGSSDNHGVWTTPVEWSIDADLNFRIWGDGGDPAHVAVPAQSAGSEYEWLNGLWVYDGIISSVTNHEFNGITYFAAESPVSETEYKWIFGMIEQAPGGHPEYTQLLTTDPVAGTIEDRPQMTDFTEFYAVGEGGIVSEDPVLTIDGWSMTHWISMGPSTHGIPFECWDFRFAYYPISGSQYLLPIKTLTIDTPGTVDFTMMSDNVSEYVDFTTKTIVLTDTAVNTVGLTFYALDGMTELLGADRAGKSYVGSGESVLVWTQIETDPADPCPDDSGTMEDTGRTELPIWALLTIATVAITALAIWALLTRDG